MRRLARILLIAMVAFVAAAAIMLSTRTGQSGLLRIVAAISSSDANRFAIGDLQGSLFGEGAITDVSISDESGPWLEVRGIAFSWTPFKLLSGRLDVAHLRVDDIAVLRNPKPVPTRDVASEGAGFSVPLKLSIDDLDLRAIEISDQVVGERLLLRLTAAADINDTSSTSAGKARLIRLDGPQGELSADFSFVPADRSLEIRINGSEPEGGVVAELLGLPSRMAMSVQGHGRGTLDAWQADLSLAANGRPFLASTVRLDAVGPRTHRLSGHIAGFVENLVPHATADIFSGKTEVALSADILGLAEGSPYSISNARADISSAAVRIAAAGGIDLAEGFIHGGIEGRVSRPDGQLVKFADDDNAPAAAREITFRAALPNSRSARQITATIDLSGIEHPQFSADQLMLSAQASQPDPAGRRASALDDITIGLAASGVNEATALGRAVGSAPRATLLGSYDGGRRLDIRALDIETLAANGRLTGVFEGGRIDGTAHIQVSDLSSVADIAGRPLKGQATVDANVDGNLETQTFAVSILAGSKGLGVGLDAIDSVLKPETRYSARIEQAADGTLSADDVSISNDLLTATLQGSRPNGSLELSGNVGLASLAAIYPDLAGKAQLHVNVSGSDDDIRSSVTLSGEGISLNGKPLEEPAVSFVGRGPLTRHAGKFAMSGAISGETLAGRANIVLAQPGAISIDGMAVEIAGARLSGAVDMGNAVLPSGQLNIDAQDLARLGNAIGVRLAGRVHADVALSIDGSRSAAKLNVAADNVAVGDLRVADIRSTGEMVDYMNAPEGAVGVRMSGIAQGAKTLGSLSLDARREGGATTFRSSGHIDNGAFELSGNIRTVDQAHEIEIASTSYSGRSDIPAIHLSAPAHFSLRDGKLAMQSVRLAIGDGAVHLDGSAASNALDVKVTLERVPASLAAIAAPELGIAGNVSGTATIRGQPANPQIAAQIAASGLSIEEMRSRQLPPVDITGDIAAADGKAQVKVNAKARGGVDLTLAGAVGYQANGVLALSGRGTLPLALANVFLADRAARVDGAATLTVEVSGEASAPRVDGRISIDGATLSDAELGLELKEITVDSGFSQDKVTVKRLAATSKMGGTVNAEGTVLLSSGGAPTVDASIGLAAFRFGNQDPVAAEISGKLRLSGLAQSLTLRGDVHIARMDITVPNRMPQSVSALDIRHVNASDRFQATGRGSGESPGASSGDMSIALALNVRASDRIFVRGRGVDAQLGGAIEVLGTSDQPFTDGQFTMTRGRLAILGRQLDFSRGNIVFTGSPEPLLDMEAQADADSTVVTIRVSGPASQPELEFTSSPQLPEDEIVSLLLFNKQLANLSSVQVVQLASEIDKIGGLSSGPATLDKMKSALGIDVLDFTTDEQGQAQATAGSFINDKTYVGVKQGMSIGQSRIVIDHELTRNLKARGEVGTDGKSKLGLGVEWSY